MKNKGATSKSSSLCGAVVQLCVILATLTLSMCKTLTAKDVSYVEFYFPRYPPDKHTCTHADTNTNVNDSSDPKNQSNWCEPLTIKTTNNLHSLLQEHTRPVQHVHLVTSSSNNRMEWQRGEPITLALARTKKSQSEGDISVRGGTSSRDRLLTLSVPSNLIKQKVELDVNRDVSLSRDNPTQSYACPDYF